MILFQKQTSILFSTTFKYKRMTSSSHPNKSGLFQFGTFIPQLNTTSLLVRRKCHSHSSHSEGASPSTSHHGTSIIHSKKLRGLNLIPLLFHAHQHNSKIANEQGSKINQHKKMSSPPKVLPPTNTTNEENWKGDDQATLDRK